MNVNSDTLVVEKLADLQLLYPLVLIISYV